MTYDDNYLIHYGVGHTKGGHSGRYPWGSGKNPFQSEGGRKVKEAVSKAASSIKKNAPIAANKVKVGSKIIAEHIKRGTLVGVSKAKIGSKYVAEQVKKGAPIVARVVKSGATITADKVKKGAPIVANTLKRGAIATGQRLKKGSITSKELAKKVSEDRRKKLIEKGKLKPNQMTEEELKEVIARKKIEADYLHSIGKRTPQEITRDRIDVGKEVAKDVIRNVMVPAATGAVAYKWNKYLSNRKVKVRTKDVLENADISDSLKKELRDLLGVGVNKPGRFKVKEDKRKKLAKSLGESSDIYKNVANALNNNSRKDALESLSKLVDVKTYENIKNILNTDRAWNDNKRPTSDSMDYIKELIGKNSEGYKQLENLWEHSKVKRYSKEDLEYLMGFIKKARSPKK